MIKSEADYEHKTIMQIENCCEIEMRHFMDYMDKVDLGDHKEEVGEYMRTIYCLFARALSRNRMLFGKMVDTLPEEKDGKPVRSDKLPSDR